VNRYKQGDFRKMQTTSHFFKFVIQELFLAT